MIIYREKIQRLVLLSFCCGLFVLSSAQGYKIDIQVKGIRDTTVILGHYYEKKMLVDDTLNVDSKGYIVAEGEKALPEGLYFIYFSEKERMDIILGINQTFKVSSQKGDLIQSARFVGSPENSSFYYYMVFLSSRQKELILYQSRVKALQNNDPHDSVAIYQEKIMALDKDVKSYLRQVIDKNKENFLGLFLKGVSDVEIPDFKVGNEVANKDSVVARKQYQYFRQHYFDHIDFTDERLLRTPFFAQKIETYLTKGIPQMPDTVAKEAFRIVEASRPNPEMFKFMVMFVFNVIVNQSNTIMGMDKAYVLFGERYYLSGEANWAEKKFIAELADRIARIRPTMVGEKAHDLKMQSINGDYYKLSEINAPYIVLVFWEPGCGHCKTEIPKLYQDVWLKYKDKGIRFFAVYTQTERESWEKFVEEHNLFDWYNVYDPAYQTRFRSYYDISMTPVIYILDKNKNIVAKRINHENIPGFFENEMKYGRL